jgi:hypothetical protein
MSYLEARKSLGLSRETLSNLAKLAGIRVSPTSIKKLEDDGEKVVGTRGVSNEAAAYVGHVLGLSAGSTDWNVVQGGAPVIVNGSKGVSSFVSFDGVNVSVINDGKLQTVASSEARAAANSAVPSADNAHLFEARTRGDGGVYSKQILNFVSNNPGYHGVGAIAATLGLDNGVVSRTVAGLIKSGKLDKVSRGVVTLGTGSAASEAPVESTPEASTEAEGDDLPRF